MAQKRLGKSVGPSKESLVIGYHESQVHVDLHIWERGDKHVYVSGEQDWHDVWT